MLSQNKKVEQENLREVDKNKEKEESLLASLPIELLERVVNGLDYPSAWSLSQASFFFRRGLLGKERPDKKNMLQRLFDYEGIFAAVYHAMRASQYPLTDGYVCPTQMKMEVKKEDNRFLSQPEQIKANECLFKASLQGHNALPIFTAPQGEVNLGYYHWMAAFQHIIFNPLLSNDMRIVGVYVLLKNHEKVGLLSTYFEEALKRQYGDENIVDLIEFYVKQKYPSISFVQKIDQLIIQSSTGYYQTQDYQDVKSAHAYWKKSLDSFIDLQKQQLKTNEAESQGEQGRHSKRRCILM